MKSNYFQIRISEEEKRELSEAAELIDVPASQLVRECLRKKIAEIKRKRASQVKAEAVAAAT